MPVSISTMRHKNTPPAASCIGTLVMTLSRALAYVLPCLVAVPQDTPTPHTARHHARHHRTRPPIPAHPLSRPSSHPPKRGRNPKPRRVTHGHLNPLDHNAWPPTHGHTQAPRSPMMALTPLNLSPPSEPPPSLHSWPPPSQRAASSTMLTATDHPLNPTPAVIDVGPPINPYGIPPYGIPPTLPYLPIRGTAYPAPHGIHAHNPTTMDRDECMGINPIS